MVVFIKKTRLLISIIAFIVSFIVLMGYTDVYKSNSIIISCIATTGPDYNVVIGSTKLLSNAPETSHSIDASGIMVDEVTQGFTGLIDMDFYTNKSYLVTEYEIVGLEQSDSPSFHPLVKIKSCKEISKLIMLMVGFIVLISFISTIFYIVKH